MAGHAEPLPGAAKAGVARHRATRRSAARIEVGNRIVSGESSPPRAIAEWEVIHIPGIRDTAVSLVDEIVSPRDWHMNQYYSVNIPVNIPVNILRPILPPNHDPCVTKDARYLSITC